MMRGVVDWLIDQYHASQLDESITCAIYSKETRFYLRVKDGLPIEYLNGVVFQNKQSQDYHVEERRS